MEILQFAGGGDIGGAKTHILSLAKELSADSSMQMVSFRKGVFAEEAKAMGLDVVDLDNGWRVWRDLRQALKIVDRQRPDIIHCHGARANMIGVLVKRLRRIPVMTTVHSDPRMDYLGNPWKQCTFGLINAIALRKMDFYIAVADRMESNLIQRGFDPQKIFTIFNGLDFSDAPEAPVRTEEGPDVVVGIAARLTAVKDIGTLLKAFTQAHQRNPRLKLLIAGTGEDEKELKELARKLGVAQRVEFVGWVDDIADFYSRVDINVLSSLSEGFPYSLLEGAHQHCAAIASRVGGIPSLITHGENGYLFEPGDVDTFGEYIYRLSVDRELRSRLAENLFRRARGEFSLGKMKELQQKAYGVLLRQQALTGRQGAVICGAYGRGNAGDEAILRAILQQMRRLDEEMPLWVMSRNKRETRLLNKVKSFYIFNLFSFMRSLKKARIFINGGGSLIQDVTSSRSLYFYLFTLKAAKWCGCRIIMYGCGIGPIHSARNRRLAARILNSTAEIITLRDSVSHAELVRMGVDRPVTQLAADPTVNLPPAGAEAVREAFRADGIPPEGKKIGFCIRSWPGFAKPEAIARAADYAYEKYGLTPVFLPAEIPKDIAAAERVTAYVKAPCYAGSQRHSVEVLMGMLGSMDVVVAMRLHALIFATMGGAPVVGISYDVKVASFIKDIGSDASISLEGLDGETLCRQIDLAVARGGEGAAAAAEHLRQMEKRNGEAAAALLTAAGAGGHGTSVAGERGGKQDE
ncbi:MAG: polysaccharide pyruvyl transferase CsaB [Bacillota bacterium]|nr:polysaccharide pyruvyl transferase CsaB [Bacillota bacterium]